MKSAVKFAGWLVFCVVAAAFLFAPGKRFVNDQATSQYDRGRLQHEVEAAERMADEMNRHVVEYRDRVRELQRENAILREQLATKTAK